MVAGLESASYGLQSSGLAQAGAAWQQHRRPVCLPGVAAASSPTAPLPHLLHCREPWCSTQVLSHWDEGSLTHFAAAISWDT